MLMDALTLRGYMTAAPLKRRYQTGSPAPLPSSPRLHDRGPIEAYLLGPINRAQ